MAGDGPLRVLTDGACPLCRRLRAWIQARSTPDAVVFVDLHQADLARHLPSVDLVRAQRELTAIDAGGSTYTGVGALQQLARRVPALRGLAWIWKLPGIDLLVAGLHLASASRRCRGCPDSFSSPPTTAEPGPARRRSSRRAYVRGLPGNNPPMRGA